MFMLPEANRENDVTPWQKAYCTCDVWLSKFAFNISPHVRIHIYSMWLWKRIRCYLHHTLYADIHRCLHKMDWFKVPPHDGFPDGAEWSVIIIQLHNNNISVCYGQLLQFVIYFPHKHCLYFICCCMSTLALLFIEGLYFLTCKCLATDFREMFSVACESMMRKPKLLKNSRKKWWYSANTVHASSATLQYCGCIFIAACL